MSTARKASSLELFFQLTRRHFLVFFKNKVRLFYTLLVPVIIFCVYVLFLRALEKLKRAITMSFWWPYPIQTSTVRVT